MTLTLPNNRDFVVGPGKTTDSLPPRAFSSELNQLGKKYPTTTDSISYLKQPLCQPINEDLLLGRESYPRKRSKKYLKNHYACIVVFSLCHLNFGIGTRSGLV